MSLTKGVGGRSSDGKIWNQVKKSGDVQGGNPKAPRDTITMKPAPSNESGMFKGGPIAKRSRENMEK